jgi:hypothetical protein
MRSTPVSDMENTAEMRRELKTITQAEKIKWLPSHPLHQQLQQQPLTRLKRQSLKHIAQDLHKCHVDILKKDPDMCEDLQVTKWTPERSLAEFRTTVPGVISKGSQPAEVQKALTLETIDTQYPRNTWTHVYTDGSSQNAVRNGGSGIFVKHPDGDSHSISVPAAILCSNYRAELQTLDHHSQKQSQMWRQHRSANRLTVSPTSSP